MESLTNDQLKTIVDELATGIRCYLHRLTGELITFPNIDQFADTNAWQEEMANVDAQPDAYLEITSMSSRESFQIMERFIEQVASDAFRNRLLYAIGQPKPFRRFKQVIDESGEYRQEWFTFRQSQTVEWLRQQLAMDQ